MRKSFYTLMIGAMLFMAVVPRPSMAVVVVPAGPTGGPPGGGPGGAGAIVGIAGFLVMYDLMRRLSCSGDFLQLGGPGFSEPMTGGNVMIPQCQPPVSKPLHSRG